MILNFLQRVDTSQMTLKSVNDNFSFTQFENTYLTIEGRAHKIFVKFTNKDVSNMIFITCQIFIFMLDSPIETVKAYLQLRPNVNHILLYVNFQAFDPKGSALHYNFWSQICSQKLTFRVKQYCLLRIILALSVKFKHKASIDSTCYKC